MSLPTKRLRSEDSGLATAIFTGSLPQTAPLRPSSTNTIYFENLDTDEAVQRCLRIKEMVVHVFDSAHHCNFKYIAFSNDTVIRINPKKKFTNLQGDEVEPPEGKTKTVRTVDLFIYKEGKASLITEWKTSQIAVKWRQPNLQQSQLLLDHLFQNEIRWLQQLSSSQYTPSLQGIVTYQSISGKERKMILLPRYPATLRDYITTPLDPEKKCVLRNNILQSCSVLNQNVHRDLSADNLFIKDDFSVVIGDLGGMIDPKSPDALHDILLGSVEYMAPEIACMLLEIRKSRGYMENNLRFYKDLLTPIIDAFSLGRILYELRVQEDGLPDNLFDLSAYEAALPHMNQETQTLEARASLQGIDNFFPSFFHTKPFLPSVFGEIVWGLLRPFRWDRLSIEEAIELFDLSRGRFVPVG